jgi:drug/metabolite transporter (DMT)-like permease
MPFKSAPAWALFAGAAFWGVVWYPYRLMGQAGLDGIWATLITYSVGLLVGACVLRSGLRIFTRLSLPLVVMGAAIGWSNLAYVLGVLQGEVMRVLLLFYLAPLWTVPLAHFLLHERLDRVGLSTMALATSGALIMLWHPELGLPIPNGVPEWLGLAAGFLYALGNVLVRKLSQHTDGEKSLVILAGVALAACVHLGQSRVGPAEAWTAAAAKWPLVMGVGGSLVFAGLALQYGLSRLPANRAIVILLSELVVAAIASYWLAGESLRVRDWIGGALIIAATVVSALRVGSDASTKPLEHR